MRGIQGDDGALLRRNIQILDGTATDCPSVLFDCPDHPVLGQVGEEILIAHADPDRAVLAFEGRPDILVLVADLIGMRMQGTVRSDDAVAVERAVRRVIIIEIPAEGKDMVSAVFRRIHRPADCLVHEVPDITALVFGLSADQVPVLLVVAHRITHRMGIFALDQRLGRIAGQIARGRVHAHVHRAVDIGLAVQAGPFILHRAGRIISLDPIVGGLEIRTVTGLVAQAPDYDAGVVEIPQDHPLVADQVGRLEIIPAGQGRRTVTDTVGLDVPFIGHIQAILVAERIPTRVVRIVGRTHRIDIQLLHNLDILNHLSLRDDIAARRTEFVAVGALDEYRLTVDQELPVFDFHAAEAETDAGGLIIPALAIPGRHGEGIEIRLLGTPKPRCIYLGRAAQHDVPILGEFPLAGYRHLSGRHRPAGPVIQYLVIHPENTGRNFCRDRYVAVHIRNDVDIFQPPGFPRIDIYAAGDTCETPEVLILQVGAVAPAHHLQGDGILPCLDKFRDVETGLQFAVFAVTHFLAIDPDPDVGRRRADAQADLLADPVLGDRESTAVLADVVFLSRYFGRIALEMTAPGIADVQVERIAVAIEFQHARHRDRAPVRIPETYGLETGRPLRRSRSQLEFPRAVQAEGLLLDGREGRRHRKTVLFIDTRVLPVGQGSRRKGEDKGE